MLLRSTSDQKKVGSWLTRFSAQLDSYESIGPAPFFPLVVAFIWYAFVVFAMAHRPLWHDELYTYYIAKSPTLARFAVAITQIDLQPPLQYLLSRMSLFWFGDSEVVTRLPSLIAFTVASVCLYLFVQRRLGRFYALTATLILWLTPFLQYAAEARPYALVLGFFSVAMLGWQMAADGDKRRLGLIGIGLGVWGMLVSHAFSPLLVAILGMSELVRSWDRRKIDWPVWIALAASSPFMIVYAPMFRRFEGWTVLPPEFQASSFKIIKFYMDLFSAASAILLVALVSALIVYRSEERRTKSNNVIGRKHEIALVLGLFLLPIGINLFLMRTGGAFWPRYSIATTIAFSLLCVYLLAKLTDGSRAAAGVAAGCIFVAMAVGTVLQIVQPSPRAIVKTLSLNQLDSSVPLVTASGLAFLEMNKREDPALLSRVYYLTDRDAAVRYAHATIFEGTEVLKEYFPIRGTVTPYRDFVRDTPRFFVLGTPDFPEDWLIAKLLDDGAELQFKGELLSTYRDHMIFEVKFPPANAPAAQ